MNYQIKQASIDDYQQVAVLFDSYRQFYQQRSDINLAQAYLKQRLEQQQSIIFHAVDDTGDSIGFTQLYPSFCSVALKPLFILYDLYVAKKARQFGVGRALMNAATQYAQDHGAVHICLETAITNSKAQALYESLGYEQDDEYLNYFLELDDI